MSKQLKKEFEDIQNREMKELKKRIEDFQRENSKRIEELNRERKRKRRTRRWRSLTGSEASNLLSDS